MRNDTKNQKPFRPLVYICSPFSGDVEGNTERTRQFCRFALEHGQIPLAPHLMFPQFVNDEDPEERNLALFMDIVLQGKCQELWVLGDVISEGMSVEIETAKRRRQPVRYSAPDLRRGGLCSSMPAGSSGNMSRKDTTSATARIICRTSCSMA